MPKRRYKTWGTQHAKIKINMNKIHELMDYMITEGITQINFSGPSIEDFLDEWEPQARKVLRDHKLDENWGSHVGKDTSVIPELAYYACDFLKHAERVRRWLTEKNALMSATETVHMMQALQNLTLTV